MRQNIGVLELKRKVSEMHRVLETYDATTLIGLKVIVHGAVIEDTEDDAIEVPNLNQLKASVAMARCLTPIRLRGSEMKAMRKIMKLTLAELAEKLDERTAPETVSRWESEAQPMGGYAEKLFRLLVCEQLKEDAPGIGYNAGMIANMRVQDPWRSDSTFEMPPLQFSLIRMKERTGAVIDAWEKQAA